MLDKEVRAMQFFVLRHVVGSSDETEFETVAPTTLGEAPTCPVCREGYIGMKPWLPPYTAEIRLRGEHLGDVAFGVGDELLVSEAFRQTWIQSRLLGIDAFNVASIVRVRASKASVSASPFYCIEPRYGSAWVDFSRSRFERNVEPSCLACGKGAVINAVRGFSVAEGTWGGEDMFRVLGLPGVVIVSARFRKAVEAHRLKNVPTVPVASYYAPPLDKRSN